jgi:MFS family permease
MNYELKKLTFGETIGKAFNMYLDNFIALFFIVLICSLPTMIMNFFTQSSMTMDFYRSTSLQSIVAGRIIFFIALFLLGFVLSAFESGLVVNYVAYRYIGKKSTVYEFLKNSARFVLPLIGLSILITLCVFGVSLGAAIPAGLISIFFMRAAPVLGIIILYAIISIPVIIIYIGFSVSTQVLVIEKKRIIESMKKSWELTKNFRGKIFLYFFLMIAVIGIIFLIFTTLLSLLLNSLGLGSIEWINLLLTNILLAMISPFFFCLVVLIYFNLRIEKEGFAIEHLVDQFSITGGEGSEEDTGTSTSKNNLPME